MIIFNRLWASDNIRLTNSSLLDCVNYLVLQNTSLDQMSLMIIHVDVTERKIRIVND